MSVVNSKKLFTKILDRIKLRDAASGGTDPSIVTTGEKYTWNQKVDPVSGKGLSTEDYTTEEKTKLSGIATGATNVEIDNTLTTTGKAADAKKVGDEVSDLKENLTNSIYTDVVSCDNFVGDYAVTTLTNTLKYVIGIIPKGSRVSQLKQLVSNNSTAYVKLEKWTRNLLTGKFEHEETITAISCDADPDSNYYILTFAPFSVSEETLLTYSDTSSSGWLRYKSNTPSMKYFNASLTSVDESDFVTDNSLMAVNWSYSPSLPNSNKSNINQLSETIDGFVYPSDYELTWIANQVVDPSDGTFDSYSGWSRTDYTEIIDGKNIIFNVDTDYGITDNVFYDYNKDFISSFTVYPGGDTILIPEGAYYFVISSPTSKISTYKANLQPVTFMSLNKNVEKLDQFHVGSIPDYYVPHILDKCKTIRTKNKLSANNGDAFVFITDYHEEHNSNHSFSLVDYVLRNTGTRFTVFGGDSYNSKTSEDAAVRFLCGFKNKLDILCGKAFCVIGNHEYNTAQIPVSQESIYSSLVKKNEGDFVDTDGLDYVFDNKAQKIRYFVVGCQANAGIYTFQVAFIAKCLENLPEDYRVIFISHVGMNDEGTSYNAALNELISVISAFISKTTITYNQTVYDYTNTTGEALFMISGHSHFDTVYTLSNGFPIIATTCDAYQDEYGELSRTAGTITEQAFDIVNVDITNRIVYLTRIGAGQDRTVNF